MIILRVKKQKAKKTALQIFTDKVVEIDNMLARLVEANDNHYNVNPDELHWGHAGSITDVASNLKEITDSVFKEGEYAE